MLLGVSVVDPLVFLGSTAPQADHNCASVHLLKDVWVVSRVGLVRVKCQSCLTLCDPMDCSPPGSSVCGISQARILEWVAISFSRGSSQHRD